MYILERSTGRKIEWFINRIDLHILTNLYSGNQGVLIFLKNLYVTSLKS